MGSGLKTVEPSELNRAHYHLSGLLPFLLPCLLISVLLRPTIGYGQQYALTVRSGFGGGSYAAADSAFVLTNPTPADFVFDRWQTTAALRNTLAISARPVTLNLVDRAALARTPILEVRPKGIIMATNPDVQNIQAILALFQSRSFITTNSICFTEHKFHSDQKYDLTRFFDRFAASIITATTPVAFIVPALQAYLNPHPELGGSSQRLSHAAGHGCAQRLGPAPARPAPRSPCHPPKRPERPATRGIFPALNHRHHPADAAAGPPVDLL